MHTVLKHFGKIYFALPVCSRLIRGVPGLRARLFTGKFLLTNLGGFGALLQEGSKMVNLRKFFWGIQSGEFEKYFKLFSDISISFE